jgi:hypothetical protein
MYLVVDQRPGLRNFIFTHINPRLDGFKGEVIDDVSLDYDVLSISLWKDGWPHPDPQLGRDPNNQKYYKVFKYPDDLRNSGFVFVHHNAPLVVYSWTDYRKMFPVPMELAESLDPPEWFDYLDEIDAANAHRSQRVADPVPGPGSTQERIAEWIARRHQSADASIRQVWYLPTGAPVGEIRLVEVSNRVADSEPVPETIDFGVDVAGQRLKVVVADVTRPQFERMQTQPTSLPAGWSLDGAKQFREPRK